MADHLMDARDLLLQDAQEEHTRKLREHLASGPSVRTKADRGRISASNGKRNPAPREVRRISQKYRA
jgi:hypothetical protein